MEIFFDLIDQGFLDIFTIFSLGIQKNAPKFLKYFFLIMNASLATSILTTYVLKGKLIISADALSQITDVFELFAPILTQVFLIFVCFKNHKKFEKIHKIIEKLDKDLKVLNSGHYAKVKISSTISYGIKFFTIHMLGVGIDSFVVIR